MDAINDHQKCKGKSLPKLTEVSEKQYKGATDSKLFDPARGTSREFDMIKERDSVVTRSPGSPLYFMQQINLGGQEALVFYDTGAMFNLVETKLARKLGLKMTTRRSMYVVGAGNNIHTTGDGKYELVIAGSRGEKYVLECAGSREVTNDMLQADFTDTWDAVSYTHLTLPTKA